MLTEILVINLVISGVLLITGFYFKEKALFLSMAGSIILIITGIIFSSQGVDIISGATETVSGNITEIVNNRTTIKDSSTDISSFILILIGFAGMTGSAMALNKRRNNKDEYDDQVTSDSNF